METSSGHKSLIRRPISFCHKLHGCPESVRGPKIGMGAVSFRCE